jgi:hypothetical protein
VVEDAGNRNIDLLSTRRSCCRIVVLSDFWLQI